MITRRVESKTGLDLVVIGSLNVDYVVDVPRQPQPGETILGGDVRLLPGGKGANQAVAAVRAGARVAMVGCVGDDADAQLMLDTLSDRGVDTGGVQVMRHARTGNAYIHITPDGENTIIVAPGANHRLDARAALRTLTEAPPRVVVMQGELRPDTTTGLLAALREWPADVVLNLAPVTVLDDDALGGCDTLVVNAGEAAELLRRPSLGLEDASAAAADLRRHAAQVSVITLGRHGAVAADGAGVVHVPAPVVDVVDTTGAGDVFVGTLAACMARRASLREAVEEAVAAAARAVGFRGAQPP